MFYINNDEEAALKQLGERLEQWRLQRNESQESLAARIGISLVTYSKMTQGMSTVKIGYWVRALSLLSSLGELDTLLKEQKSFFSERDKTKTVKQKRIKRKRS